MKAPLSSSKARRWLNALHRLVAGNAYLRTPFHRRRSTQLLMEELETRLVPAPVTFGQFFERNGTNDFTYTNNSGSSATLGTISGGSAVYFNYSNIVGLPTDLATIQFAHLTVSITTSSSAVLSNGELTEALSASGTLKITRDGAAAEGFGLRNDLLTVTFTANMSGTSGGNSATLSGSSAVQIVSIQSDFLDFSNTTQRDLSLSFTSVTPNFTQGAGNFLTSFVAAATGTFDSDPPPKIAESTLAGTVYQDLNNNGTQDGGEPGISESTLVLTGSDDQGDAVNLTTTTDASGNYTFTTRPSNASGYTITETQPSDFLQGTDSLGPDGGSISQTPTSDTVSDIVLPIYVTTTGYNFGELPPASVSGAVFIENDNNAVQNAGEPGIAGVTVTLTGTSDKGAVSLTTTTNASGQYSFTDLRPANGSGYTVTETQPSGVDFEKENAGSPTGNVSVNNVISAIPIGVGTSGTSYNFAMTGAQLAGTVYEDKNANGSFDGTPTDATISGVTLVLTGKDIEGNPVSLTTTTNANGAYTFSNLRASNGSGYTITETQPSGYLNGADTQGTLGGNIGTINVTSGIDVTTAASGTSYNFGEVKPASVSGAVFIEEDDNAVQNPGEPAIPGGTITLTGTDAYGNPVSLTTTTNASGQYSFTSLTPSNGSGYSLTETQPSGVLFEKDNPGSPAGNVTVNNVISAVPVGDGTTGTGYNFAATGANLTGTVYEDVNTDSSYDEGDKPISGVTLVLTGTDIGGNPSSLTTTTGADGSYTFSNLRASNAAGYAITETQPTTYLNGADTQGTLGGNIGTINVISAISVGSGQTGTSYNFGEVLPSSVSGSVFVEHDDNGTQNTGEPLSLASTNTTPDSDAGFTSPKL